MRFLIAGVSAVALLAAAGCGKDKDGDGASNGASTSSAQVVALYDDADMSRLVDNFKPKDYGDAAGVIAALDLTPGGEGLTRFEGIDTKNGVTTLTNFAFALPHKSDDDEQHKLVAETLVLEGLHQTDAGAAFDRMTLNNVKLADAPDGASMTIGQILVFEPNDATANFMSKLVAGDIVADVPTFAQMGFDRFALSDISMNFDASKMEDDEEGYFELNLEDVSVDKLTEGVAGGLLLNGLRLSMEGVSGEDMDDLSGYIKLDQVNMAGLKALILDDVAEAFAAGAEDEAAMGELMAAVSNRYMDKSPIEQGFDAGLVKGLDFSMAGLAVTLDEAKTLVQRDASGAAIKVSQPLSKIAIKLDAEGGEIGRMGAEQLSKLGYDELEISSKAEATYDPVTDLTRYNDFTLDVKDMVKIKFDGGFTNLSAFMKGMNEAQANGGQPDMAALQSLGLNDMTLTIEDESILDRGFKLAGEMQGMEPAQLRAMATGMLGMATMTAGQTGADPELISEAVTALSNFIEKGGALTLSLQPDAPVVLSDIEDPSQLSKATLGFSATHSE